MSHAKLTTRFYREPPRCGRQANFRARVPAAVKDYLGASEDDEIVFEPGDDRTHTLAALRGRYMIVRVNRPCASADEHNPAPRFDDDLAALLEENEKRA